ncbi:transporter [Sphingobium jiangsuense]|uniref:Membrane fusion protein (Multidrug efflux system) n=1 Tax=Sphingobium jiangsuense TaxID=870476 RepID=A0A7W6BIR7_9SPHN|nr:HlyD family secretion protein [Sphingobium jiangsuense]MBB3927663.1 membrane fusion protein (multidrug efflux system) [Sphingobium jiangsuense]GLT02386.1 transporter [Sphingobium jiangsuense]
MSAETTAGPIAQDDDSSAGSGKNRRARRIILIIAAAAVTAGALWFARHESYGKYQQSTNDAYVQTDGVTVSPKVSGYVDKVFVIDNQEVKAGQPLVQIDPRDYRAQAEQSHAQIALAAASAAGTEAQIREQQSAIAQAEAQLAAAQADADFANSEVARYQPLAQSGAETKERLSQLRNQAAQANAKLASARAAAASARQRVATLEAQIRQAQAQGQAARAQLSAANTDLQSTIIRAATNGRIGDKTVQQGQFVQPATRLMTLMPADSLYIEANFKETQVGLMRVGQPVSVEVDALPGVEIRGTVASISPGTGAQFSILPPQNATGNFTKIVQRVPVRIAIHVGPETRKLLVPGMSVEVSVDTRSAKGATEQIRREQEQYNRRIGK